jgi:hypothetical protein
LGDEPLNETPWLADQIVAAVERHPAVREVAFVGSRAEGRANPWSDWDFRVAANDFAGVAEGLPDMLVFLDPLVQQWDPLSPEMCWMLILRGPAKVDLIFPDEPHSTEPPWTPTAENLGLIDGHFWDWALWLKGKEAGGKIEVVTSELEKLFDYLLAPLGVERSPTALEEAVGSYREARDRAEKRFGVTVRRDLDAAAARAFE